MVFFAIVMGILGLIFYHIGISMGWLYDFMGVVLGAAVVPIACCITWRKANKWGCIVGAVTGFCCGIIAWLVATSTLNNGIINVTVSPLLRAVQCGSELYCRRPSVTTRCCQGT